MDQRAARDEKAYAQPAQDIWRVKGHGRGWAALFSGRVVGRTREAQAEGATTATVA